MNLPQQNGNNTVPAPQNPPTELEHVMQEMYKKNLELNDRNKTLALLRKIDEIVLSSVTDLHQIAQQVSDLLVQEEFNMVGLFIVQNSVLIPLSISSNNKEIMDQHGKDRFTHFPISFIEKDNILVKAVEEKTTQVTPNLFEVFRKSFSGPEAISIQQKMGIKSIVVYPLKVRLEIIGVLIIGITEEENDIPGGKKRLIDRLAGVVGIALDNSLLYQSIQEANERLKQLDKLKDEFVSLASHELRTPMTIIKSYLWMFLAKTRGSLPEKEQKYIERAYESTERLINLVNDMLNVSRIESGRLKLETQDLEIVGLIDKVVTELVPRAQQLGLTLIFTKPQNPVGLVRIDPERIEQVMINLVGNSLKFTPFGGSITVTLVPEEKDVLIKVIDTGKGMTPDGLKKLFQKFGTMGGSYLHKEEGQGTGLGLYLSKSLIELQGGKIWAESPGAGFGATFSFTLLYSKSSDAPQTAGFSGSSAGVVVSAPSVGTLSETVPAGVSAIGGGATGTFK